MLLSQYDRVVCLCVDSRLGREAERVTALMEGQGVDPSRFSFFVDGDGALYPPCLYGQITPRPPDAWQHGKGAYAHFCGMKAVISAALAEGVENLLWIEDDLILTPDFGEVVAAATAELESIGLRWDLLYYGANHTWATTQEVTRHVLRCQGSLMTHCLGIRRCMFQKILDLPAVHVIDNVIAYSLHHAYQCMAVWPNVAWQQPGFSLLSNMPCNYFKYMACKGANWS